MAKQMGKPADGKNKKPFSWSRLLGYGLVALGLLSIVNFFSPIPIPTIGITAIISGVIFTIGGALMITTDKSFWAGIISRNRKRLFQQKINIDPLIPVKILKLSKDHNGILTASEVAIKLNVPLPIAEAGLDECVRFGHAMVDFDMKRELKYYKFPEHLPVDDSEKPDNENKPQS
ncbi:MAG: hypothetical protein JW969_16895 [Spirochaetales bacterium]|nr:hypothetical protein [Spirochaetales bacterium]